VLRALAFDFADASFKFLIASSQFCAAPRPYRYASALRKDASPVWAGSAAGIRDDFAAAVAGSRFGATFFARGAFATSAGFGGVAVFGGATFFGGAASAFAGGGVASAVDPAFSDGPSAMSDDGGVAGFGALEAGDGVASGAAALLDADSDGFSITPAVSDAAFRFCVRPT